MRFNMYNTSLPFISEAYLTPTPTELKRENLFSEIYLYILICVNSIGRMDQEIQQLLVTCYFTTPVCTG